MTSPRLFVSLILACSVGCGRDDPPATPTEEPEPPDDPPLEDTAPPGPCDALPPVPVEGHVVHPVGWSGYAPDFDEHGYAVTFDMHMVGETVDGRRRVLAQDIGRQNGTTRRLSTGEWVVAMYGEQGAVVARVDPESSAVTVLLDGFIRPIDFEVDADERVYVADHERDRIVVLDPFDGTWSAIPMKLPFFDLTVTPDGQRLFVSAEDGVYTMDLQGGAWGPPVQLWEAELAIWDMTTDLCGNLYALSVGLPRTRVWRVSAATGEPEALYDFSEYTHSVSGFQWGSGRGGWEDDVLYVTHPEGGVPRVHGIRAGIRGALRDAAPLPPEPPAPPPPPPVEDCDGLPSLTGSAVAMKGLDLGWDFVFDAQGRALHAVDEDLVATSFDGARAPLVPGVVEGFWLALRRLPGGDLLAVEDPPKAGAPARLVRIDPEAGTRAVLGDISDSISLEVGTDGRVYFADPTAGVVRAYAPDTDEVVDVAAEMGDPTYLALSPDEQTLYVSARDRVLLAIDRLGPDSWDTPRLLRKASKYMAMYANLSYGAMQVDACGNLYVAELGTIWRLTPDGQEFDSVAVLPSAIRRMRFGSGVGGWGSDKLYVQLAFDTYGSHVWEVEVEAEGKPE